MTLIGKPFITIIGDNNMCEQIVSSCIPNLPMEPTEWTRKQGSEYKLVHVDIDTKPYQQNNFYKYDDSVLGSPLLHIFVMIENEEIYNNSAKELFGNWIGNLRSRSWENWKVIIVPDDNVKQKNKFVMNKFTLSNKLKTDFNLTKIESHSIRLNENPRERFNQMQKFLRDSVLSIYDSKCFKIEDKIRIQREAKYTRLWNYFDYFYLQEELADIYECLNLYDESLALFDESDFVFSNCIEAYQKDETTEWINHFREVPFEKIDCLILTNYSDPDKRCDLSKGQLCLADFRAYLLSRQCALLQLLNRYKRIPDLVYSTLLKFLNECKLLKIKMNNNLKQCWIFLTALQALQRFSPIDCEEELKQDYAALFRLALNSINELAESLNIWVPEQIEWAPVEVLRNKLNILSNDEFGDTPSSRLAGGFRSQKDFQDFHSKLFEEAIMIWKHIGRIRSANLLGIQLADLYYKAQQYDKPEPLYIKAIKCFRDENWASLAMPLRLKLAVCQKDKFENDPEKSIDYLSKRYLKTCVHLAGATFSSSKLSFNPDLSLKNQADHKFYYTELIKCIKILFDKIQRPQIFKLNPLFTVENIQLLTPSIDGYQMIKVMLNSHLPQSTNITLEIYGQKYQELNLSKDRDDTDSKPINYHPTELPAEHYISLTPQMSPKGHRDSLQKLHHKSSLDDESLLHNGVYINFHKVENEKDNSNDEMLSLICFPKCDVNVNTRKVSISHDVGLSVFNGLDNEKSRLSVIKEDSTLFSVNNGMANLTVNPGTNEIILKSQEYGLYLPNLIEISMFQNDTLVKDKLIENMMDHTWTDYETIQTYLPSVLIDDPLDNFGFINFTNQINPKIKIGKLAFPANEIKVMLYDQEDVCVSSQSIKTNLDQESAILKPEQIFPLNGSLEYNLHSSTDKVVICIPNVVRKKLAISYFEDICLSKNLIQTVGGKYIISVLLQRNVNSKMKKCNFLVRNPSLKLHHNNNIRQLLPFAHRSLATGVFNDRTHFTILWILESNDIINFDMDCLKFTLTIDLKLDVNSCKQLLGTMVHDFELRNN